MELLIIPFLFACCAVFSFRFGAYCMGRIKGREIAAIELEKDKNLDLAWSKYWLGVSDGVELAKTRARRGELEL
jgi:hypothetical protein